MITATYHYYVDWDGNNSFALPGEDISAFVFEASWEYGRDYASQLNGRSKAGSCRISLDNSDSRFSPFNASSPPYDQMLPVRRVRVTMQIRGGSEVTTGQGFLESVNRVPAAAPIQHCDISADGQSGKIHRNCFRSLGWEVGIPEKWLPLEHSIQLAGHFYGLRVIRPCDWPSVNFAHRGIWTTRRFPMAASLAQMLRIQLPRAQPIRL